MDTPVRKYRFRHVQDNYFCIDMWDGKLWAFLHSVAIPKKFLHGEEKVIAAQSYAVNDNGVVTKLVR